MNSNEASLPKLQLMAETAIARLELAVANHSVREIRDARKELRATLRALMAAEYQHGFNEGMRADPITCLTDLLMEENGHV